MTIKQAIDNADAFAKDMRSCHLTETAEKCEQLAAWLRELQERRKEPEIVHCGECKHNGTHNCLLNLWATIFNSKPKDDFFCGMAERRTDDNSRFDLS